MMRNMVWKVVWSVLCFHVSVTWACNSRPIKHKRIYSGFASENIRIGSRENNWDKAEPIRFRNAQASDNKVAVRSLWNNDSLYFRFEVTDKMLRAVQTEQDHPELFLDDMVEILIDANNDKDSCWSVDDIVYHINILGIKKDDRGTADCKSDEGWNGDARYAVRLLGEISTCPDEADGYIMEVALPWTELDLKPVPGLIIGINFANGDNDGNGRQLFDWVGTFPLRSPFAFGSLVLVNRSGK